MHLLVVSLSVLLFVQLELLGHAGIPPGSLRFMTLHQLLRGTSEAGLAKVRATLSTHFALMATPKITFFFQSKEPDKTTEDTSCTSDQLTNRNSESPPRKKTSFVSWDIAQAVGKPLSTEERYSFLSNKFDDQEFTFPKTQFKTHKRSFQPQWLKEYPGLTYSPEQNAAFCLPCVLFNTSSEKGCLVSSSMSNWKDARTVFEGHFRDIRKDKTKGARGHQSHMCAMERYQQFLSVLEDGRSNVLVQLQKESQKKVDHNKHVLNSVFKSILFCGKQGIALRGHRDDYSHIDHEDEKNCGNFHGLIKFRAESGDKHLASHLQAHSQNATYLSKTTQNECIEIIGENIQEMLIEEIKAARFFAVSADEVQDLSNKEQLAICLRYVDTTSTIREVFVGYVNVSGDTTGETLSRTILDYLKGLGLDANDMRGQCYDGAGNMAGVTKGVGPRIQKEYPKALHYWCASHQLNRAIVTPCQMQQIRNMMAVADKVARFFNFSSKRQKCLEEVLSEHQGEVGCQKIKELCRTRWTERHVAFDMLAGYYEMIVEALERISTDRTYTTCSPSDATSLLLAITDFQFVIILIVVKECLAYMKQLSTVLQGRSLDIVAGFQHIKTVKTALEEVRTDIDAKHQGWFAKAEEKAANVGVEPTVPRTCKRQTQRSNTPASCPTEFYKRNITIPLVDHILAELDTRFSSLCESSLQTMKLIPSSLDVSANDLGFYESDMPSPPDLPQELHLWKCHWQTKPRSEQPTTALATLKACNKKLYPNIHT